MTTVLRLGYVPLADAALPIVAQKKGFAEAHGLTFDLVRETSWANIRDKLALGYFDAAHMLAPAAIACTLGLAQVRAPLTAVTGLGLNGNAITVSPGLYEALLHAAGGDLSHPLASARALRAVVTQRKLRHQPPLTFAHVFPFSSHHYQLRIWMRAGGVDPEDDVNLLVLPPPFMARSLEMEQIDGFCVGAPWNSVAVEAGAGIILHPCCEIVRNCPEKVLAVRADWALGQAEVCEKLSLSILDAARWCTAAEHLEELGGLLAEACAAEATAEMMSSIVAGRLRIGRSAEPRSHTDYLRLDPGATQLSSGQALWLYAQMVGAGQIAWSSQIAETGATIFDGQGAAPDMGAPEAFAGPAFDPANVREFIRASALPL